MACVICPRLNAYEDDEIRDEAGRIQMTLGTGTEYEGEYEKTNVDLITQHYCLAASIVPKASTITVGPWFRSRTWFVVTWSSVV